MRHDSLGLLIVSATSLVLGCDGDTAPPLWTADSQTLSLACGSFFEGSMQLRARRDQLSAAELASLAGLQVVAAHSGCAEDIPTCRVEITDAAGAVHRYNAGQGDPNCWQGGSPLIGYERLASFLAGLPCRYSKAAFFSSAESPIVADPRCLNGLFTSGEQTVSVSLDVNAPGVRHIELDGCGGPNQLGKLSATIVQPSDGTVLATLVPVDPADAGAEQACASLDYTFAQAGTYRLDVVIAAGFLPVGDFFLRYY